MSDWVKTSYVQPWADTRVLVCIDDDVFEATYREDGDGNPFCYEQLTRVGMRRHLIDDGPEVYWMYLPEPPEEDE